MIRTALLLFVMFSTLHAQSITIGVAANVSYAIDVLKKAFEAEQKGVTVRIVLSGSGKLTAQIMHGAPYDLFMSANMAYPQALYEKKIALAPARVYAQGKLALFSTHTMDFSQGIAVLNTTKIQKIAIANPKTAPYGLAAMQALKADGIYKNIKHKLVYAESISQTLSYALRATDVGIVAKSLLYSPKMAHFKENENYKEIDTKLYTPIQQGIVILKHAKNNPAAEAFYRFIFSKKAEQILQDFGYITQ